MNLIRLWAGPLPKEELFPTDRKPNFILHWIIHPIKRRLAKIWLLVLKHIFKTKIIAIAGSNGKTTTRNMLINILKLQGHTVATADSITPTYNIPTTILKSPPWTRFLILEMSVEYIGDMDFYLWLSKPHIAIMTMIDIEHTAHLKDLNTLAFEENKLLKGTWIKITNGNSPKILETARHKFSFGLSERFDCYIKSSSHTKDLHLTTNLILSDKSELNVTIPTPGLHLAFPAAAAALTARKLGISHTRIQDGLKIYTPAPHRLTLISKYQSLVLDDTYNSNPSSAKASIDTLVDIAKSRSLTPILFISQMNELGNLELSEHAKLQAYIQKQNIQKVFSIGPAASKIGTHMSDFESLKKEFVKEAQNPKNIILVKSSRSWRLDRLFD